MEGAGAEPPVPSVLHQILVELFRNRSELAPELLRICAGIELPHDHVQLTSNDLSQVVSTEYRADFVVELRDRANAIVAAVIVEVQLRADPDKEATWPLYVAALRAKLRCPVTLLVVAPEPAVARWARRPIELGHPGFRLQPGGDQLRRSAQGRRSRSRAALARARRAVRDGSPRHRRRDHRDRRDRQAP